jgi:glycosyltransferase involved in cell wall biosynthesis
MRTVYLINLSFGLAGTERRFANIWNTLRTRGNVRPVLVVPDTLAELLHAAGLATPGDELLWVVREHPWSRALSRVRAPWLGESWRGFTRSRVVARAYRPAWDHIRRDPAAVIHVGLNCSALVPPDAPLVYECMDSLLTQLGSRHYVRAAGRRSIINCQTERIRLALEHTHAHRRPRWTTVTSPNYFASYPDVSAAQDARDRMLIAFVGRFAPEKSPLLFLDAIARVRAEGLPARAVMLGEGPLLPQMRRRIDQLGLGSVVEAGFNRHPADRLAQAAVCVSLQTGDNYGSQSLLEAMGAGCAVVVSDVGETRRLVGDEVGLRVGLDVAELAGALGALLRDPARTAGMGAAAAKLARTRYTADSYVAYLEALYARAVEVHGGSPAPREPAVALRAERHVL